jgi:hypothetical protein
MGTKRLETVSDCIKHDLDLQTKCPGGRVEILDAREFYMKLVKAQKPTMLNEAATFMLCKRCKRKQCRLIPVPRF